MNAFTYEYLKFISKIQIQIGLLPFTVEVHSEFPIFMLNIRISQTTKRVEQKSTVAYCFAHSSRFIVIPRMFSFFFLQYRSFWRAIGIYRKYGNTLNALFNTLYFRSCALFIATTCH